MRWASISPRRACHHASSFKFQYAIFYHITMFLRIVFVEAWGSHHWKPQVWKLPDRRRWTLLPHDSTGKLPRYRINQFDRYRFTLNLTGNILKWSTSIRYPDWSIEFIIYICIYPTTWLLPDRGRFIYQYVQFAQ